MRWMLAAALLLTTTNALADGVDCPPGSVQKTSGKSSYCQPSVCALDAQCAPGEVCTKLPLCVEVGKEEKGGDLLMARQRCGIDRACPDRTNCLDGMRCVSKAVADKLTAPASSAPSADPPAKKACGCRVVGDPASSESGLALLAVGLGVVALDRRRSAKRR